MSNLQLEGNVDNRDQIIEALEEDNRQLKRELIAAKAAANEVEGRINTMLAPLRGHLLPLYNALQIAFGDMEALGVTAEVPTAAAASNGTIGNEERSKWEHWKQRLGPSPAKIIDALLIHGQLTNTQIQQAAGMHHDTTKAALGKLRGAGLLVGGGKGGMYSLKQS